MNRLLVEIWTIKLVLVRAQKEVRATREKVSPYCREQNLVEIGTLKALLARIQKELRSVIVKRGVKMIPITQFQKTWLNSIL